MSSSNENPAPSGEFALNRLWVVSFLFSPNLLGVLAFTFGDF